MSSGYWNYYSDNYEWDDEGELVRPDLAQSRAKLVEAGMSETDAQRYVASGFVYSKWSDTFIDRYYGGALMSVDARTRVRPSDLIQWPIEPQNRVWVKNATSWVDVRRIVDEAAASSGKRLLFRGQTQNHLVNREIHNPWFVVDGIGEISLVPSVWRRMLNKRTDRFPNFQSLGLLDWSQILYQGFDMKEIERRHQEKLDAGEWMHSMQDMADSDDSVLSEFGNFRLDLAMGMQFNLAALLSTLLQHYGLYSHVLDLTTSLEVAMFFATHKFRKLSSGCSYEFIGTNERKSVIYVLREDHREMNRHESLDPILRKLQPLRPQRQHCIISLSSPYALNLPADFLVGVIRLDFDSRSNECGVNAQHLLPDDKDDAFLKALKSNPFAKDHLTDFTS